MSSARVVCEDDGPVWLEGTLSFDTVPALLDQYPADRERLEIDLGRLEKSNTAGLALLLDWLRRAKQDGHAVFIRNIPDDLRTLAHVNGVEDILPLV